MAGRETPATTTLRRAGVPFELHEYAHDPGADSYALEAVEALGPDPERVLKTLVVRRDAALAVCVVAAGDTLDLRALGRRSALADPAEVERATGYVTGGISPVGQRRRLPTLVDERATATATV